MSPGYFSLKYVCERFEISPKTVKRYVEEGLLPAGLDEYGKIVFDEPALATLAKILRLRDDLGVNLAGIDIILRLCSRIEELQEEIDRLRREATSSEAVPSGISYPSPTMVLGGEIVYARIIDKK